MVFTDLKTKKQITVILCSLAVDYCLFMIFITFANDIFKNLIPNANSRYSIVISVAFFSAPGFFRFIGAIIFSGLGDSPYRNKIFYFSTVALSVSSLICGCLPTISFLNIFILIILGIIRISNGLFIGAVVPKALIFCYAKVPPKWRILSTCLIHFAEILGFMIAIIFTIIFDDFFQGQGWRIGMLSCGLMGLLVSYMLRLVFHGEKNVKIANFRALRTVFIGYKWTMFRMICFATFLSSGLSMFFYVMPDFIFEHYGYDLKSFQVSSIFLLFSAFLGIVVGIKLDRLLGKRFYLLSGIVFKFWLAFAFHSFIKNDLLIITLLCSISTFVFGLYVAKLPVMIIGSFPKEVRFIGVAIVYNISFGIMFAVSHRVIHSLIGYSHSLSAPSMYIIFFSYVSIISLWFMPKRIFNMHYYENPRKNGKI